MATKRARYMISVDDDMFKAIEDFRFENRYQTRSEATAELIRLGLEALKKEKSESTYLYGEAAAYGGESAKTKSTEENLKELFRMKGETEEQ